MGEEILVRVIPGKEWEFGYPQEVRIIRYSEFAFNSKLK